MKVEEVGSNGNRQDARWLIKVDDPQLAKVCMSKEEISCDSSFEMIPSLSSKELGELGYEIGKNTSLKELDLVWNDEFYHADAEFCQGIDHNHSIEKIMFRNVSGGGIFNAMSRFFKTNHSLAEIVVEKGHLDKEGIRLFSIAITECSNP